MNTKPLHLLLGASIWALAAAGAAQALTVDTWNTSNVVVGAFDADPNDDVGGASVVYDREIIGGDTTGANTYGKVVYIAPESNTPGIKVVSDPFTGAKKQEFDGCIMASSGATCDSEFQSGKRIKQQVTGIGPIDLVFDVFDPDPQVDNDPTIYEVFHRLINVTGQQLSGFTAQLGTGVGKAFQVSSADDGLGFAQNVKFGPDDLPAFTQFPYGLFGGDPANPNPLNLPGFFDTEERAGLSTTLEEDTFASDGFYGTYDDRFGNWLSQEAVPQGLFYDFDPGNADPLAMAWDNGSGWEFLRGLGDTSLNPLGVVPISSVFFAYDFVNDPINGFSQAMLDYLAANFDGIDLLQGAIEDLANLNLTFALELDDKFAYSSFTLRVTPIGVPPAVVPLPAGAPLLIGGLAALAMLRRKRRAAA